MGNDIIRECSCFRKDSNFKEQEDKSEKKFKEIEGRNINMKPYINNSMQSINYNTADIKPTNSLKSNTYDTFSKIRNSPLTMTPIPAEKISKIQGIFKGYKYRKLLKQFNINPSQQEKEELKQQKLLFKQNSDKTLDKFKEKFREDSYMDEGLYTKEEYEQILNNNNIIQDQDVLYSNGFFGKYQNIDSFYEGYVDHDFNYSGLGKLLLKNGELYNGYFKFGELNGWGRYIDTRGNCYEGLFLNGNLKGKGYEYYDDDNNNNIKYKGDFNNFKKEGLGYEESDECVYEGEFRNDAKNGKGKLRYKTCNDNYDGQFTDGVITGYGTYYWENGHTYTGDFVDGKMHGNGLYCWPDGSMYKGEYINNIKEGQGEFTWKDGRLYKGSFKAGKPHGFGKLTVKGITVDAKFISGKFDGNLREEIKKKKLKMQNDEEDAYE